MRLRTISLIAACVLAVFNSGDGDRLSARTQATDSRSFERIRFHIVTVEEKGAERKVISESTIEGPPNTDFNINLEGQRFRMSARFLTDLIRPDKLRVRTKLDTRRLYGSSERDLPLYEEDEQSQSLEIGFDESVVLLPFGRSGDHRLKIEITPAISIQTSTAPSGQARPLEINILKPSPGGIVRFEAMKIPHNFVAELALFEDGQEIGVAEAPLLIEEGQEITLQPKVMGHHLSSLPVVNLIIERYARSRPADQVTFAFDIYQPGQSGGDRTLTTGGAGVASLGSDVTYDLSGHNLGVGGKKYELRFKFKLAANEQTD